MSNVLEKVAIPQEVVDFYSELAKFQQQHNQKAAPVSDKVRHQAKDCLKQGAPLINLTKLPINKKEFQMLVKEMANLIIEHRPNVAEQTTKIKAALLNKETDYKDILSWFVWQDEAKVASFIEEHQLERNLVTLFLLNLLRPVMQKMATGLKELVVDEEWLNNYCPICGWSPLMAKITAPDHKRYLHCSLCGFDWLFKRLECVYCGHNDPKDQKYFTVEGDEDHQVVVCSKCKGYLKTVDENKVIPGRDLIIDDVKTLYLDILAEQEGYSKNVITHKKQN